MQARLAQIGAGQIGAGQIAPLELGAREITTRAILAPSGQEGRDVLCMRHVAAARKRERSERKCERGGERTKHRAPRSTDDRGWYHTASTATTPGTALMAPAICGETLKRPGSLTSTSVPRSSIRITDTSPSGLAGPERAGPVPSSRLATLSI